MTLLNAAASVSDEAAKQLLLEKLCGHIGVKVLPGKGPLRVPCELTKADETLHTVKAAGEEVTN